jgi:hypothetical protein
LELIEGRKIKFNKAGNNFVKIVVANLLLCLFLAVKAFGETNFVKKSRVDCSKEKKRNCIFPEKIAIFFVSSLSLSFLHRSKGQHELL